MLALESQAAESTVAARSEDRSASEADTIVVTASVCVTSTTASTERVSNWVSAQPASTRPIGEPIDWSTPPAASDCGRRARGTRRVMSAGSGAFTSDMKNPASARPVAAISHEPGTSTSQIAVIWQTKHTDDIASGSIRRTSFSAVNAPTTAPPPSAPNSQPTIFGFAPYSATTSTGNDAKSSVQHTSSTVNAGNHTRSSRSLTMKRRPANTPRWSSGASNSGGCTNSATSTNESTNENAST